MRRLTTKQSLISIIGTTLLGLTALITLLTTNISLDSAQKIADITQKLITTLGVITGGIFAYYKFFKGRTFSPRLELTLSGSVTCHDQVTYLLASAKIKNVGLSKVSIIEEGTGLRSFTYQPTHKPKARSAQDYREATHPIFKHHAWIEPGETIEDQHLIAIPSCVHHLAFRLELWILSEINYLFTHPKRVSWTAVSIVNWEPTTKSAPIEQHEQEAQTQVSN